MRDKISNGQIVSRETPDRVPPWGVSYRAIRHKARADARADVERAMDRLRDQAIDDHSLSAEYVAAYNHQIKMYRDRL